MKKLYVINGTALSGKDTFIEHLQRTLCSNLVNIENHDSVGVHKQALESFGWNGIKDEKSREFLVLLKEKSDELFDTSFNYIVHAYKIAPENSILFYHVREPDKIQRILDNIKGSKSVFIKRNTQPVFNNSSDKIAAESNYKYDYVINNDGGLYEFYDKAINFYEDVIKHDRK